MSLIKLTGSRFNGGSRESTPFIFTLAVFRTLRERLGIFACFRAPRRQAVAELWTKLARNEQRAAIRSLSDF